MEIFRALETLKYHAGIINPDGFANPCLVGLFRPYSGLDERSFAEFVEALSVLNAAGELDPQIRYEATSACWAVCSSAYIHILDSESAIRRHHRIDQLSLNRVRNWYGVIDTMGFRVTQGLEMPICVTRLLRYIIELPENDLHLYRFADHLVIGCLAYDMEDIVDEAKLAAVVLGIEVP